MSRPSRGFTVTHAATPSVPTCPSTVQFIFISTVIDNFEFFVQWAPGVTFGSLVLNIAINGGPFFEFQDYGLADTPVDINWDLSAVANVGDLVVVEAVLVDAGACPDLDITSEQQTLT